MENNSSLALQNLLANVTTLMRTRNGEEIADIACVQEAQELGCEVATGATFTKLVFAIEAEIAKQNAES
jgi:hypothetical protein